MPHTPASPGIRHYARPPLARCVMGALVAGLPAPTLAAGEGGETSLPAVTVSAEAEGYRRDETGLGKLPGPLRDQPQSITVIPDTLIKDQGATSLREALRNVSGISFNAGEGGFSGDNINLRGFTARNDLFLDGVRDNGQYTRDVFNIEQVDVLKGPSSMLFGRGTTGGAINQVSKRPHRGTAYTAGIAAGTDELLRTTVDLNQPLSDTAAFRLNGMWHNTGATAEVVEFDRYGIAPSLTLGLGTDTQVNFSYFRQKEDNVPFYGVPYRFGKPVDVDESNFYGLARHDYERTTVDIASVTVDHRFSDALHFSNRTQYAHYQRDLSPTAPRIAGNPPAGTPYELIGVNRGKPTREGVDTVLSNMTDVTFRFDTDGLRHTLVTGMEVARETSDARRYTVTGAPPTNLADPDPYSPAPNLRMSRAASETDASANSFNLYAIDEIALNTQWKVVAGLRWDRFAAESRADTFNTTTGALTSRADKQRTDKMTSGRLGLIYQPDAAQSYYVAYGTSFNPTAETLTISNANDGLEPEKNVNYEIGARFDLLDGALSLRGALFRTDKTNARTLDPDRLNVNVLDGRWVSDGIELEVAGRLDAQWQVFAGAAWMDPEITESNNPLEVGKVPTNAPRHTYSLWTTYDIDAHWQVGGGVQGAGKRYGNNTNTVQVPGYARWDAEVAYREKDYDLRLNVFNLTDRHYYEGVYAGHAVPGNGRSAMLSVDYRF